MNDFDRILRLPPSDPRDEPWPDEQSEPEDQTPSPQEPHLVPILPEPSPAAKTVAKHRRGRLDDTRDLCAPELNLREGSDAPSELCSPERSLREGRDANEVTRSRGRLDSTIDAPAELCTPEQSLREGLGAKHRRGGQPGNKNAFKHGFYARNLGLISPNKLDEFELRNLLGEAAMLKDYMYILYNCNLAVRDSAILAETLRGLSMAGMALSRLLQVHNDIRITRSDTSSNLRSFLDEMDTAASHATRLVSSTRRPPNIDDLLENDDG